MSRCPVDHVKQTKEERYLYAREWKKNNPEKVKAHRQKARILGNDAAKVKARRQKVKEFIQSIKRENPCQCGESRIYCLDFRYRNKADKKDCISNMIKNCCLETIVEEIQKCDILCSNCRKMEYSRNESKNKVKYVFDIKQSLYCSSCGISKPPCLDFHHVSNDKEMSIGEMIHNKNYTLDDVKIELLKCIVLCSNCHRHEHYLRKTEAYQQPLGDSQVQNT